MNPGSKTNKIALIGTGKTGSKVADLLGSELSDTFDQQHPPTIEKLKNSDGVIIFVPGSAVSDILPIVLEAGIPAAWGSTGYIWPDDLHARVIEEKAKWVVATNFSLGMNVVRKSIEALSAASTILRNPEFYIHEVHHIHKKDAPSGTALSWKEWLAKEAEISSAREGDINGIHELSVITSNEKIQLRHEALDRALFAEGAIWSINQLISNNHIQRGVMHFAQLFDLVMEENQW